MHLKCTMWGFDTHVHSEMVTTIRLMSTSITSHCYILYVCVVRTLKIYCLSKFLKYTTFLIIVTLPYILYLPKDLCHEFNFLILKNFAQHK